MTNEVTQAVTCDVVCEETAPMILLERILRAGGSDVVERATAMGMTAEEMRRSRAGCREDPIRFVDAAPHAFGQDRIGHGCAGSGKSEHARGLVLDARRRAAA